MSQVYNIPQWVKDNEHLFSPPICNKLMYNEQLNIMFVGGPNTRKDYHIDCGEEFFYQMKGNMSLPTRQKGKKKIVNIKEGQVYLLRARVPHSPQRPEKGSLGLVIERQRIKTKNEMDCLRYYVQDFDKNEKDQNRILWEKWFYCYDLGTQLPPVVNQFHASNEFKTHKPANNVSINPPVEIDNDIEIADPIDLYPFIEKNKQYLLKNKKLDVYSGTQTTVSILTGPYDFRRKYHQQTWIYCMKGSCRMKFDYSSTRGTEILSDGDCLIVNKLEQYQMVIKSSDALIMSVSMDVTGPIPRSSKI